MSTSIRKKYPVVDVMKYIMALTVLIGHAGLTIKWENQFVLNGIQILSCMNNFYFFTASGFLLFSHFQGNLTSEENLKTLRKKILTILKLELVWIAIYLPFDFYASGGEAKEFFKYVLVLLVFRGGIAYSEHLWFLYALWLSILFIYIVLKIAQKIEKKRNKPLKHTLLVILVLAVVFYLFAFYLNAFFEALNWYEGPYLQRLLNLRTFMRNGRLFLGPIYVTLGMLFALGKIKLPKWLSIAVLAIHAILVFFGLYKIENTPLLVFSVIALFDLCQRVVTEGVGKKIYPFLRKSSTVMYYSHYLFIFLSGVMFYEFDQEKMHSPFTTLFAFAGSMILSVIAWYYRDKKVVKFLFS